MMNNNSNFILGMVLIVIGGLWIAGTLGLIQLSVLFILFKFWPVLLILAGINIISKGNKGIVLLSLLLVLAGAFYLAQNDAQIASHFNWHHRGNDVCDNVEQIKDVYELQTIESATLELDLGVGDISIVDAKDDQFAYNVPGHNLLRSYTHENNEARILFRTEGDFNFKRLSGNNRYNYDFELPKDVLWTLDLDVGAADGYFDFSDLMLERVKINTGASDCKVIFGDRNDYTYVDIDSGVSDLTLEVKKGLGLRIESDGAISDHNYKESGLVKFNGYYATKDYENANKQIEIKVDSAVSDVYLKFY